MLEFFKEENRSDWFGGVHFIEGKWETGTVKEFWMGGYGCEEMV